MIKNVTSSRSPVLETGWTSIFAILDGEDIQDLDSPFMCLIEKLKIKLFV